MFGQRREIEALRASIDELAERLQQLDQSNRASRALLEDTHRLEDLAERAVASRTAAEAALEAIQALVAQSGPGRPRFRPGLNKVYQADTIGYVTLSLRYGSASAELRLLVGPEKPPVESICAATPGHDYASGIVRPGEYWMIESHRVKGLGSDCLFTPLN